MHLPRPRLHQHLSLRLWLAVVAAITVMTLLLGWMWRAQWEHERAQRPGREVVVRNADGQVLGRAPVRLSRGDRGLEFDVPLDSGETLTIQLPRPPHPPGGRAEPFGLFQSLGGFVVLLVGVALAVALGAYPVVRRLTQRLETLQRGVQRWGEGDLGARVPVQGRDEVAFLAERFNAAAERVQSLLQAHKTLLANASHELRSPLARIRMGLALLEDGVSPAQRREIERNIAELDELIDEILLASRLDLADPNDAAALGPLEEVDLLGLAAEEWARSGATLDVADGLPPAVIRGHARLLRRLLRNLLENARRHGLRAGDPASVTCALQPLVGGPGAASGWTLSVSDRGPGVPAEQRERIFQPFYRLPGASEREGGVGLGLALVRTIAERHGGHVRCEAHPGGGARFAVFLPV
jgi:signal transduction histidine kinase